MEPWSISKSGAEFHDLGGKNQYLSKAQGMRRLNQHLAFKTREMQDVPKDRRKEDPRYAWTKLERCFSCTHLALLGCKQDTVIITGLRTPELCYSIKWCLNFKEKKNSAREDGVTKEGSQQLQRCLPRGSALKACSFGREHSQNLIFKSLMVLERIIKVKGYKWTKIWSTQTCIKVRMCSHKVSATWFFHASFKERKISYQLLLFPLKIIPLQLLKGMDL